MLQQNEPEKVSNNPPRSLNQRRLPKKDLRVLRALKRLKARGKRHQRLLKRDQLAPLRSQRRLKVKAVAPENRVTAAL